MLSGGPGQRYLPQWPGKDGPVTTEVMDLVVRVRIVPRDHETEDGFEPALPTAAQAVAYLDSLLGDRTTHDGSIGWRVTRVRSEGVSWTQEEAS